MSCCEGTGEAVGRLGGRIPPLPPFNLGGSGAHLLRTNCYAQLLALRPLAYTPVITIGTERLLIGLKCPLMLLWQPTL